MKKTSLLAMALAPLILGAPLASMAQSVTTDPVGFVKTSLPTGYTALGINLAKPASSATVVSVSGNTITLSAPLALGAGSYYVEVADGALEGDRVDVASVSDATLTLSFAGDHNTLASNLIQVDSRVIIREHFTFADVSAILGSSLHTGGNFPDSSDQIITWEAGTFVSHAVFDGEWYDAGGNPADGKILPPGSGLMFYANPDAPVRELDLLVVGEVRNNDFVRPLGSGYQFISTGFPTDESPASLMMTDANFTGTEDPATADKVVIWQGGSFAENWMFTDGSWYDAGGNPVSDAPLFTAGGAALVYLNGTDPDFRVANRIQ